MKDIYTPVQDVYLKFSQWKSVADGDNWTNIFQAHCLLPCPLLFFFFNDIHKIRGFFLVNTKFEKWNVGDILGISVSRKQYETKNNASNLGFFCYFYLFIFFFHFLAHWHSSRVIISGQRRMHRHCQSTALCCAVDTVKDTWP